MPEPLPQRGFTPLPPPRDGIDRAVSGGRRIRLRRRLAGAGGALSVAVAVAAVVVSGSPTNGAMDELVPAAPTSASPTPSSSESPAPARSPATAPSTSGGATPSPAPDAVLAPADLEPAEASPRPGEPVAAAYRTPDLVRRYRPASTPTGGPAGHICSGGSEYGGAGLTNGTGYCLTGYAVRTDRGHDLVVEVCRDSTGPGRLRFPRELEADLLIHDPDRADRVVWQWSAGRSNDEDVHALDLETNACWTWTAPWTEVDASGAPLETGRYELQVRSHATEVRTYPAERVAFTVD